MLFSKSVVDDIAMLALFEIFVAQLWRSLLNCASFAFRSGAVLRNLRHWK
jgi:hypothetical protein